MRKLKLLKASSLTLLVDRFNKMQLTTGQSYFVVSIEQDKDGKFGVVYYDIE